MAHNAVAKRATAPPETAPLSRRAWPSSRFFLFHLSLALILGLLLFAVFDFTDLDQRLTNLFYDPAVEAFPLRHNWFLEVVLHHWSKYLLILFGLAMLAGVLASSWLPALTGKRDAMLYMFLAMALGTASVSGLKAISNKHCPYDLEMYGGYAPYVPLLATPTPGVEPGRCFPGGHASGGFSLIAAYFIWRRRRPRLAYFVLAGTFIVGFLLGFGRIMQGAHFLSHNLWTAWVCWVVAVALYPVLGVRAR